MVMTGWFNQTNVNYSFVDQFCRWLIDSSRSHAAAHIFQIVVLDPLKKLALRVAWVLKIQIATIAVDHIPYLNV